jgi:hypothetical protein
MTEKKKCKGYNETTMKIERLDSPELLERIAFELLGGLQKVLVSTDSFTISQLKSIKLDADGCTIEYFEEVEFEEIDRGK